MLNLNFRALFFWLILCFYLAPNAISQDEPFRLTDTRFEVDQTYTSHEMRFQLGQYTILPYSYPYLDSIAQFLLKNEDLSIEIGTHSDSRGSIRSSRRLTQRRARSLKEYLVESGIDSKRLRAKGFEGNLPNSVYQQEDTLLIERPSNEIKFERIVLTSAYINQFKLTDRRKFDYLHHLNRRTEFRIIGFNGVVEMDNTYFSLASQNLFIGQIFKGRIEFRYNMCKPLIQENDDFILEERPGMFDSLVLKMDANPQFIFQIQTHTDSRGSEDMNFKLTEKRAIHLGNYFIKKGVSNHQLRWKGFGEDDPATVYLQSGKYLRWKPENDLPFEKVQLTFEYINQFKSNDWKTFEMLHQLNRRTEIKIVGTR